MAGKSRRKLRPIATLSRKQQERRRFARSLGMKDEHQLNRLVKKLRALPESDKRHLRAGIPRDKMDAQIKRAYKRDRKTFSPWREIKEKKKILVDDLKMMSSFTFYEQYKKQLDAALHSPSTSDYGKKQIRQLQHELERNSTIRSDLAPTRSGQGRLF